MNPALVYSKKDLAGKNIARHITQKTSLPLMKSSIEMPSFDLQSVLEANAANEINKVGPYQIPYLSIISWKT